MKTQSQETSAQAKSVIKVPGWDQYPWLLHGFSTRPGGVSTAYGDPSLNLGWTKEDDPAAVAENRRRFLAAIQAGNQHTVETPVLITIRQIHSGIIRVIREGDQPFQGRLQTPEGKAVLEGDGLITNLPGVLLAVGTADCVPVLVVDTRNKVVGAFHAGWRGTVANIAQQGIATMTTEFGSRAEDIIAAVGPSIGPCCYTIGTEVQQAFAAKFAYAGMLFDANRENLRLNLWEANRQQLLHAGIEPERITVFSQCTACTRDENGAPRFFSHRGEKGVAGRMLNVVGVRP